MIRPRVPFVLV